MSSRASKRASASRRSAQITREDLVCRFHMPVTAVSKDLGICATMLKKVCRKHGIKRWPHRKVQSLNNLIEQLKSALAKPNLSPAVRMAREDELAAAEDKKRRVLDDPDAMTLPDNVVITPVASAALGPPAAPLGLPTPPGDIVGEEEDEEEEEVGEEMDENVAAEVEEDPGIASGGAAGDDGIVIAAPSQFEFPVSSPQPLLYFEQDGACGVAPRVVLPHDDDNTVAQ